MIHNKPISPPVGFRVRQRSEHERTPVNEAISVDKFEAQVESNANEIAKQKKLSRLRRHR